MLELHNFIFRFEEFDEEFLMNLLLYGGLDSTCDVILLWKKIILGHLIMNFSGEILYIKYCTN